jgi:hypothetical protein
MTIYNYKPLITIMIDSCMKINNFLKQFKIKKMFKKIIKGHLEFLLNKSPTYQPRKKKNFIK